MEFGVIHVCEGGFRGLVRGVDENEGLRGKDKFVLGEYNPVW